MSKKERTYLYIAIGIISVTGIAAGSFYDLSIAKNLFVENSMPVRIISLITSFIFYGSCMFFLGVLLRQLLIRTDGMFLRFPVVVLFAYLFLSTSVLAGADLINDPVFGCAERSLFGSLMAGMIIFAPIFIFGYISNKDRYDKGDVKRLVRMISVITASFLAVKYLNTMVIRSDYRTTLGSGFVTWYGVSRSGRFLMSFKDLISYSGGTFVCGPAEYAVLFLVVFPTYAITFPSLKNKEIILNISAAVLFILVSLSALVTGANYLSDIAFAAFAGVKLCLSCEGIKLIKRKKVS